MRGGMMSLVSLKDQQGAVLAFSLIILLLLTLATVSMIQQNKNQLAITSNVGEQVKTFANVETALRLTENAIEAMRQPFKYDATKPDEHDDCSLGNQLFEGSELTLPETTLATATIRAVFCAYQGVEYRCVGADAHTAAIIDSADNVTACEKLTGNPTDGTTQCPTEVYTVDVTLTDSLTGAERTIRSKFAVGCSVFSS